MDSEIGPVCGGKRLAEIAQSGFGRLSDVPFGHQDADPPAILRPAEAMDADGVAANAPFRLRAHLGFSNQIAGRRIRSRKSNAGCLADQASSAVAADEILGPQRPAIGQLDIDAAVILLETRNLTPATDRDVEFINPAREDALDVTLPKREPVIVPGGKITDVQGNACEPRDLGKLSLREEPIGDSTLVENLDGPRVQAARARAGDVLIGAPLDNDDVDARQRQLARQHQARRPASGNHHRMTGHPPAPAVPTATAQDRAAANSAARHPYVEDIGPIS